MNKIEADKQYNLALNYIIKFNELSDWKIALMLKNKYEKYKHRRTESLRRYVNMVRNNEGYNNVKNNIELYKDMKKYLKKYNGETSISIGKKLQLKYPEYKAETLRIYINDYVNWETERKKQITKN